jgi:4-hydroxy-3-polyprenylbenzoate decarboxylase
MKLIVGISGATGSIFGIRLLEILKGKKIETHLIISSTSKGIILQEISYSIEEIEHLSSYVYDDKNLYASISSVVSHKRLELCLFVLRERGNVQPG